ncbi:hypothetical protein HanOQP8_Chr12g0458541 [Helianthus annuus]|nr:hypothetical protein HanHA89_Chr12g0482131 [Helianthus annuus]KAJ0676127.1 hypothetical protein HanLR1_Chr12g0459111 [Helianthus annuus]KAJ0679362.1 hypothetical protein HanOQP8_Chr12g0458541 [Helianthus annuus]
MAPSSMEIGDMTLQVNRSSLQPVDMGKLVWLVRFGVPRVLVLVVPASMVVVIE